MRRTELSLPIFCAVTVFTQLLKNTQKVPALCLIKHDNDFLQPLPNPKYLPLKPRYRIFHQSGLRSRAGRRLRQLTRTPLPLFFSQSSTFLSPAHWGGRTGTGVFLPAQHPSAAPHSSMRSHWSSSSLGVTSGKLAPANISIHCVKGYP